MNYYPKRKVLTILLVLTLTLLLSSASLAYAVTLKPPTNLVVQRVIASGINLTWDYSDKTQISGFEIYRQSDNDSNWVLISTEGPLSNGYYDANLTTGTSYSYKIRAFQRSWSDPNPVYSDYAGPVNLQTPTGIDDPPAPSDLKATLEGNTAVLTWIDNSTIEDYFQIQRSTDGGEWGHEAVAPLMINSSNTVTYSYTSLELGKTHKFRVRAMRYSGHMSPFSNEVSVTVSPSTKVEGVPNAPSALVASAYQKAIALRWQDNSDNEDSFNLSRQEGNGPWKIYQQLITGTYSYNDWDVVPGTIYSYKVEAVNHTGTSLSSNIVTFTAPESISTPAKKSVTMLFNVDSSNYYVNDSLKTMEVTPVINRSRTMLPIAYLAEPLGAQITYDEESQKVTVSLNNRTIELWIGSASARVNDTAVSIDPSDPAVTPIVVPPGRTMLPLSFIALNLGCKVDWDPSTRNVQITYFGS